MRTPRSLLSTSCLRPAAGLALLAALAAAPAASAMSVSYLDGEQVWQAALDGSRRVMLSTEGGFDAVAQADGGRTLGIGGWDGAYARPTGRFVVWNADGSRAFAGPLQHEPGWNRYVFPTGVDITPGGEQFVYGFGNSRGIIPNFEFEEGTVVMSSTNAVPYASDYFALTVTNPSLLGSRVVGTNDDTVMLQKPTAEAPRESFFGDWLQAVGPGRRLDGVDVAATATVMAVVTAPSSDYRNSSVTLFPVAGAAGAPDGAAGCTLAADGPASSPSLSPDARYVAWHDQGGVKVAGVPDFSGVDTCSLTSPPVVISPTGEFPSIGGATLADPVQGGGATPVPVPDPPKPDPQRQRPAGKLVITRLKRASALSLGAGITISVRVPAPGRVTATVSVPASKLRAAKTTVIARGRATARRAGTVKVRLRASKKFRRKLRRLRGVTATVSVRSGTARSSQRIRLR